MLSYKHQLAETTAILSAVYSPFHRYPITVLRSYSNSCFLFIFPSLCSPINTDWPKQQQSIHLLILILLLCSGAIAILFSINFPLSFCPPINHDAPKRQQFIPSHRQRQRSTPLESRRRPHCLPITTTSDTASLTQSRNRPPISERGERRWAGLIV